MKDKDPSGDNETLREHNADTLNKGKGKEVVQDTVISVEEEIVR